MSLYFGRGVVWFGDFLGLEPRVAETPGLQVLCDLRGSHFGEATVTNA
jgi:hypothetical protein